MRDKDKGHVPDYPKREVTFFQYLEATLKEQRSTQTFVWLNKGEHVATVRYDINGMAIGYVDNGNYFIFD